MKTTKPIQAKSTESIIKAILPDFRIANDKTSNGYKFINLLYGVEVDQAKEYLQHVYNNSFLETMDLTDTGELYEVFLSGIPNSGYLNSSSIPIKITNWNSAGNGAEFYDGCPTRVIKQDVVDISGIILCGHIVGLNYFRSNISGYGYFLINTDIDTQQYLNTSGSSWKINLDNVGNILSYSGSWPAIGTVDYDSLGKDEILFPLKSGYLSKTYPLTRRIKDDSGIYWDIDHYEPYLGWIRNVDQEVVALNNYSNDYEYNVDGKKIWHRTAFNNPYGCNNYTTEYLTLKNSPISGTIKLYDIDILTDNGTATLIPSTGIDIYKLQSSGMFVGDGSGTFDPVYVGYNSTVPTNRGFGLIEGSAANYILSTSWSHLPDSGYIDEETMQYVEGSGELGKIIKIVNPYSRYMVEYNFKKFNRAKYITSLESNGYVSYSTDTPTYSIETIYNNEEKLEFEFTKDPSFGLERSKYITFDGWKIRPYSTISKIDFNIPILVSSGPLTDFLVVQGMKTKIGYGDFVPDISVERTYAIDCNFSKVINLGTVTEEDYSGNDNLLTFFKTGSNRIYRFPNITNYSKRIKYYSNESYYYINNKTFLKDNTFFRFNFRSYSPQILTLMELTEANTGNYITIQISENGILSIISKGVEQVYSFDKFLFNNEFNDLIIRYYPDPNWTNNPIFEVYKKGRLGYDKLKTFTKETETETISTTNLHLYKNCNIDAGLFQIYYETNYDNTI